MSLVPYKITALARSESSGLNIIPEAEVSIVDTVSGISAQLWTSSAGTTAISNPFNCDSNGEKEVWIIAGNYTITVDGGQSWDITINGNSDVTVIDTWADIATTPAVVGQVFTLKQHTSGNVGGGTLIAVSGSVTDDGGTQKNCATTGIYLKRTNFDVLTLEMFGVVRDGTDESAKFQLAANKNLPIKLSAGSVKINSSILSSANLILFGDGDSCVIDATSISGSALHVTGSLSALPSIANVSSGAFSVVFSSSHGLVAGDCFIIYNPTNSSFSGFRTYYRAGEFCEVESVSGLTVNLKNPLYAAYTGASVSNYKITSGVVSLNNFKIIGSSSCIQIDLNIRPLVQNVTGCGPSDSIIYFNKCIYPQAISCHIDNKGTGGDDYGIVFGNCQHGKVVSSDIYSRRHAVATGGDASVCCVPCRDIRVSLSTLKNDKNSGVHCADMHGNTEDSSYDNCSIYGGCSWQGKNNHYRNCKIYAMSIGTVQYASEILGGAFSLENCELYSFVDPSAYTRGMIDIGGNTSVLTASTVLPSVFIVKDCKIFGSNFSGTTSLLYARVDGSSVSVDLEFSSNNIAVNDMGQAILGSVSSGGTSPNYIIVDKCQGIPQSKILANLSGGFATAPMRMQSCSGVSSLTTNAGVASKATNITFRYTYPKAPIVYLTKSAANYNGNRVGIPVANSTTTTGANIGIYTDDATAFSVSTAFDLNWLAGINEV